MSRSITPQTWDEVPKIIMRRCSALEKLRIHPDAQDYYDSRETVTKLEVHG